jgi:hypothetical protein
MRIRVSNRINIIPVSINIIWSIFLLYQFIFRVPQFETEKPDGASHLIFGMIVFTGLILLVTIIYMVISNLFMKTKIYTDLFYAFVPSIILLLIILFRL